MNWDFLKLHSPLLQEQFTSKSVSVGDRRNYSSKEFEGDLDEGDHKRVSSIIWKDQALISTSTDWCR